MTLFVVSTKDGWMDIMRRGIDARGVDLEVKINLLNIMITQTLLLSLTISHVLEMVIA